MKVKPYPWRYIEDPYLVLISEFMLQRTRANQVATLYKSFVSDYPDIESFVFENEEEIKSKLRTLGLNWRIEGMIAAIKEIYEIYHEVPADLEKLIAIKGIGQYIAGSVICFSKNKPATLVDANVVRVTCRVFGLDLNGEARRRREVVNMIERITPEKNPRDFYYSIIDIAHLFCKPHKPDCFSCVLHSVCSYVS